MKKARLLHNPTAGDNDFSKKELIKLIEKQGFECEYASVKEDGWADFNEDTDFLIVAGGDGTVRRVAKALLKRRLLDKQYPVALLPHGTANNVACSLQIDGKAKEIVKTWHEHQLKPFDIGKVHGLPEDAFFLEAFGFGIFPRLMKVMSKKEEEIGDSVEEKLNAARLALCELVSDYEAKHCQVVIDGVEYDGNYLMVEIMNIRSIGPNLILAPDADPGDGCFNVVLVPESHRKKFQSFLQSEINGEFRDFGFQQIRAKHIKLICDCKELHVDDERIKLEEPVEINVEVMPSMLEFVTTGGEKVAD
jgi:diacylglycerol kinase (ATP)